MQTLKVGRNRTIKLPKSIFKPTDEVITISKGDTFIIKKLSPSDISEIASRAKEKPMPLREIVKEVHLYRKEKKAAR